jgi:hypothetical protein
LDDDAEIFGVDDLLSSLSDFFRHCLNTVMGTIVSNLCYTGMDVSLS